MESHNDDNDIDPSNDEELPPGSSITAIVFSMDFLRLSMKNYNGFRTSQLV